jgi:hypothetical protein
MINDIEKIEAIKTFIIEKLNSGALRVTANEIMDNFSGDFDFQTPVKFRAFIKTVVDDMPEVESKRGKYGGIVLKSEKEDKPKPAEPEKTYEDSVEELAKSLVAEANADNIKCFDVEQALEDNAKDLSECDDLEKERPCNKYWNKHKDWSTDWPSIYIGDKRYKVDLSDKQIELMLDKVLSAREVKSGVGNIKFKDKEYLGYAPSYSTAINFMVYILGARHIIE